MHNRNRAVKVFSAVLGVLACTASALAVGGNVLPPTATPKGYSLSDIAVAAAVFNTGQMTRNPATPPPPKVSFQILVGDTTVKPGTMLYLPVFVVDDSGGAPSGFPADIADQNADADFLDSYVLNGFGVQALIVQVEGQTTVLNDDYVTGTTTAPLLDGTPAGTHYIVSAAFLTPLTPGKHTVSIGGMIAGQPVAFVSMNATVR